MLGNINYPVRCTLAIELKNGNRYRFTCTLPEAEKQLIERLHSLSTRTEPKEDPRQLSLMSYVKPGTTIPTVSGKFLRCVDGVVWEEVKGIRGPLKPETPPTIIKSKADCSVYGYHCGTESCPYRFYECSDREKGIEVRHQSDTAREEAAAAVKKKKRGRPSKAEKEEAAKEAAALRAEESREIEACAGYPRLCGLKDCPRSETDCYKRAGGRKKRLSELEEKEQEKKPKHSGELCSVKVVECESCSGKNCVHEGKSVVDWLACKGKGYPDSCATCYYDSCVAKVPVPVRLCAIEHSVCPDCCNKYCGASRYYEDVDSGACGGCEDIVPVKGVMGSCRAGVSVSCIDECQDTDCKYHHSTPLCKTGFPKLCNTTCENDSCAFYRWQR